MTSSPDAAPPADSILFSHLSGLTSTAAVLLLGWLALSSPVAVMTAPSSGCAGYVRGQVFGALAMELDWSGAKLGCEGMIRPGGKGIRLQFAWDQGNDERLVLVLGIDGTATSVTGLEKPANVTVIDERNGRFYSSGGTGRCWTDIVQRASLPAFNHSQQLKGRLYCTATLPALNDHSSLTLGEIHYHGHFAFDDK
jgi:hypothetical protein